MAKTSSYQKLKDRIKSLEDSVKSREHDIYQILRGKDFYLQTYTKTKWGLHFDQEDIIWAGESNYKKDNAPN